VDLKFLQSGRYAPRNFKSRNRTRNYKFANVALIPKIHLRT
jgi:hypothetical protein